MDEHLIRARSGGVKSRQQLEQVTQAIVVQFRSRELCIGQQAILALLAQRWPREACSAFIIV